MKGLLRKDFYMLWSYCKSFLLLILVFSLISLAEPNAFYTIYPVMIGSTLPVSLISYEERCKWNVYCQTLPLSRKTVVLEKYLLSAICGGGILGISAAIQFVAMTKAGSFSWSGYLNLMSTLLILSLVGPSVILPMIFKLGSEKGRYAYYFVIGAACALSAIFSEDQFPTIPISASLIPLIAAILYCLSCLLAIRFYEKREL